MILTNKTYKEITKTSYAATAEEYSQNVAMLAPLASIEYFLSLLPNNAKIIDIGCGSGRDAKIFSEKGVEVTGIDFCSELLDIAKQHAPLATFQLMDIESLNYPKSSFTGAWAACALGHIPKSKIVDVLKKIHLMLQDNGYLYLALKQGVGEVIEQDLRYAGNHTKFWAYYEKEELMQLLEKVGFRVMDIKLIEIQHEYHTHAAFRVFCQR